MAEEFNGEDALLEWATEQNFLGDPDVIPRLYDEARRRWGHLITRYYLGKIVAETLKKMQQKEERKGA